MPEARSQSSGHPCHPYESPALVSSLLEWDNGDPGECTFKFWDVQLRERRVGSVYNRWALPPCAFLRARAVGARAICFRGSEVRFCSRLQISIERGERAEVHRCGPRKWERCSAWLCGASDASRLLPVLTGGMAPSSTSPTSRTAGLRLEWSPPPVHLLPHCLAPLARSSLPRRRRCLGGGRFLVR